MLYNEHDKIKMNWVGNVAHMWEMINATKFSSENVKRSHHLEDLGVELTP
jgi:hypothetical protein